MNRKITKTLVITVTLILSFTAVAYGFSYDKYSVINTNIFTVTGTSVTTSSENADLITDTLPVFRTFKMGIWN
ncbi:MAG: hypothetical protein ACYCV0_11525 [Desulfitobacteriaceae bacterium]